MIFYYCMLFIHSKLFISDKCNSPFIYIALVEKYSSGASAYDPYIAQHACQPVETSPSDGSTTRDTTSPGGSGSITSKSQIGLTLDKLKIPW